MKHANYILESFEYFGQISSKSIVTILSYTVLKLAHFFETQCSSLLQFKHTIQCVDFSVFYEVFLNSHFYV